MKVLPPHSHLVPWDAFKATVNFSKQHELFHLLQVKMMSKICKANAMQIVLEKACFISNLFTKAPVLLRSWKGGLPLLPHRFAN